MTKGYFPFGSSNNKDQIYDLIKEKDYTRFIVMLKLRYVSDELQDLLFSMFNHIPSKRPSIKKIKQHSWMRDRDNEAPKIEIDNQVQYIGQTNIINNYEMIISNLENMKKQSLFETPLFQRAERIYLLNKQS